MLVRLVQVAMLWTFPNMTLAIKWKELSPNIVFFDNFCNTDPNGVTFGQSRQKLKIWYLELGYKHSAGEHCLYLSTASSS